MKKFSKWIAIAVVLAVAITLPLVLRSVQQRQEIRKKAAPVTSLSFAPSNPSVITTGTVALTSQLDPGSNQVTAVELHVAFDPTLVHLTNITASSAFPVILQPPSIDNATGSASITLGITPLNPVTATPVTAVYPVATFDFQAQGKAGTPQINYSATTIATAYNETGNVITSMTPGTITITQVTPTGIAIPPPGCGGLDCPTPTPTPNPCTGKINGEACYITNCLGSGCVGENCPASPCYAAPGTCQNQICVIGATPTLQPPPPGCTYQPVSCTRSIPPSCQYVLVCPTPKATPTPTPIPPNTYVCPYDCQAWNPAGPNCAGAQSNGCGFSIAMRNCGGAYAGCVLLGATPTPTPTPTPVPEVWIFLLKFTGVSGGNAVGANVTIRFVNGATNLVTPPVPVMYNGNGVYQASIVLNPSQLPPGPGYNIIIKGEKHIARKYCELSGQTEPCTAGQSFTIPASFTNQIVTSNFTGLPLDPGDLPGQDNKADSGDFDKIKTLLNKACSALTEAELLTGDLNYDGCVNTLDAFLMRKTLEIRYDEN